MGLVATLPLHIPACMSELKQAFLETLETSLKRSKNIHEAPLQILGGVLLEDLPLIVPWVIWTPNPLNSVKST